MPHRDDTISSISANAGCALDCTLGSAPTAAPGGPAAESQPIAIIPAAATIQTHQGDFFPACRALKKCLMTGPSSNRIATINQL